MESPSTDSTANVEGWDDSESPASLHDQKSNAKEQLSTVEVENGTSNLVSKDKKVPLATCLPPEVLEQ